MRAPVQVCRGDERAELKGDAVDLPVDPHSNPHIWSWAVGSDQKKTLLNLSLLAEIMDKA